MPESPDFEQIARTAIERWGIDDAPSPFQRPLMIEDLAEQLRQVWNARGAADIARLEIALPTLTTVKPGAMKTIDAELRRLDR